MPAIALLTATVTPPPGVPGLGRTDPERRLDDYARALDFYAGLPAEVLDRVVLVDNSDSNLERLEAIAERHRSETQVELLSFPGLDYPVEYGRAYGEIRLIETALSRSGLLQSLSHRDRFWKLTGRLRFTNLPRLIATAPSSFDLYADFRRIPRPWVDLRIFACTPEAFGPLLASKADLLRESEIGSAGFVSPEERLFGELLRERERWNIVPRLRAEPRIEGRSGFDEREYARPTRRLWVAGRAALRTVAPGLWV